MKYINLLIRLMLASKFASLRSMYYIWYCRHPYLLRSWQFQSFIRLIIQRLTTYVINDGVKLVFNYLDCAMRKSNF